MQHGATTKYRDCARRLLAEEAAATPASTGKASVAFHISAKLRISLVKVMGAGGFRALLSRALTLAKAEIPWLEAVRVEADGSLAGLGEVEKQLSPDEIAEGETILIAHILALLEIFVGEGLTLRLVNNVWPEVFFGDAKSGTGEK